MLDLLARIINDIHNFDIPLKIIVDTNDIWVTSTIVYPIHSIGDSGYNIM